MKRKTSLKAALVTAALGFAFVSAVEVALADEENFFPLMLWALGYSSSFPDTQVQWDQERDNLDSIYATRLEGCLGRREIDILDSLCDNRGYWVTAEFIPPNGPDLESWQEYYPDSGWQDSVDRWVPAMADSYGHHPGFYGYLVMHEQALHDPSYYPGVEYVCQKIQNVDPAHRSVAVTGVQALHPSFFDSVPSLDVFEHEKYVFTPNIPDSGSLFQWALDRLLTSYQLCFDGFKGGHTEWHAIVQAAALYYADTAYYRWPSEQEIRVQAFLALSRGATGIAYYGYLSELGPDRLEGLVTELQPPVPLRRYPRTRPYPVFHWVARLNQDLRVIGPIMRELECTAAFDTSNIPPDSYIKSVTGSDYIEVGTFLGTHGAAYSPKDTIIPVPPLQTDYFMLVNRHCLPQDTVTLTVTIEKEGTWFCRDMFTGQDTVLVSDASGKFYYTTVVGPGDGCLVLLKKAKYGLLPRDIWYEYEYIAGDVTVPDTGLVIVEPGTLIKAVPGSDNQCHGVDSTLSEIIVEGTFAADAGWIAGADTIIFTSAADTTRPGDWFGIRFRPGSSGSVRKCVIEYGYTGLEAVGANLSPIRQNNIRDTTMRMPGLS